MCSYSFLRAFRKKLGETYADMKKAYDSECLSETTVNLWHKSYGDGWDIVGLGPRGGTKKSVITEVKQSCRSGLKEWSTVFVMMVGTSKKNRVRIVIAILNKEITKLALIFFVRGRRNSFCVTSCISAVNLATKVRVGSTNAEWTSEHTCFNGILIKHVACLYKALIGFHWDNPCINLYCTEMEKVLIFCPYFSIYFSSVC